MENHLGTNQPPTQSRPSSSSTERYKSPHRSNCSIRTSFSQSTVNTICSRHSKSRPNSISNRSYSSDPNTNVVGETSTTRPDDAEYFVNYAQTHLHQHSLQQPHHNRSNSHKSRRQSEQEHRTISRNSSVKSFTSQSYNNPEYFYETNPSLDKCSCNDSKASLLSNKTSSQDYLHENRIDIPNDADHFYHYAKIDQPPRRLPSIPPPLPMKNTNYEQNQFEEPESSSIADSSDVTEPDEKRTKIEETPTEEVEEYFNTNSTSDNSYATINEQNNNILRPITTQSIYNSSFVDYSHYAVIGCDQYPQPSTSSMTRQRTATKAPKVANVESYTLPFNNHRRHRSCGSTDSFDDVEIPELFHSPSRIKWNFLAGLPDRSRSASQIGSDYKTDFDDDFVKRSTLSKDSICKIDQMLRKKSASLDAKHRRNDKTVSIWRTTNNQKDDCNAIIFHHDSELVENCCKNHFQQDDSNTSFGTEDTPTKYCDKESCQEEEDNQIYEFELCTKENCEYLLQSSQQLSSPIRTQILNNQIDKELLPNNNTRNLKNPQNMKHNKLKLKRSKSSAVSVSHSMNSLKNEEFVTWNELNYAYFIKKDTNNSNSVNLKPTSTSSSLLSLNLINSNIFSHQHKRNKLVNHDSSNGQPLNIESLIATTSQSFNNGNYYSNPNLTQMSSSISNVLTTQTNNTNGCQYINNDTSNSANSDFNRNRGQNSNNNNNINNNNNNNNNNSITTHYHSSVTDSTNSNNNDDNNNNDFMQRPATRWRYNQYNINGMLRSAHKRAKKYVSSKWTRDNEDEP